MKVSDRNDARVLDLPVARNKTRVGETTAAKSCRYGSLMNRDVVCSVGSFPEGISLAMPESVGTTSVLSIQTFIPSLAIGVVGLIISLARLVGFDIDPESCRLSDSSWR